MENLKQLFTVFGFQCRISDFTRTFRCQKRRTLLRKGHVAYSVYFVFSGSVSVDFDPDDHSIFSQKKLVTLRKGAVFGVSRNAGVPYFVLEEFLKLQNMKARNLLNKFKRH